MIVGEFPESCLGFYSAFPKYPIVVYFEIYKDSITTRESEDEDAISMF